MNAIITLNRSELLRNLSKQIPYQWRVQSVSKNKPQATCVAYIDSRDVQNVLDEFCIEGWQSDYKEVSGQLFGGIGIRINGEWEWRWDCGTESNTEKEKGRASDAFKRAAVKWGVGRFLYSMDIQYVPTNEAKQAQNQPYPVDEHGKRVWDLTEFLNRKITMKSPQKSVVEPSKKVQTTPSEQPAKKAEEPKPEANKKAIMVEKRLKEMVLKHKRGQEWLEATMKEHKWTYSSISEDQYKDLKKSIDELDAKVIEADLSVLAPKPRAELKEKLEAKGVPQAEILKIGEALKTPPDPKAEIERAKARAEKLSETELVSDADMRAIVLYAESCGNKKIVGEAEKLIEQDLAYMKTEFLGFIEVLQSEKSN